MFSCYFFLKCQYPLMSKKKSGFNFPGKEYLKSFFPTLNSHSAFSFWVIPYQSFLELCGHRLWLAWSYNISLIIDCEAGKIIHLAVSVCMYILSRPTLGLVFDRSFVKVQATIGGSLQRGKTTINEPSVCMSYRHRNHGAPCEVARDNMC